MDQIHDSIVKRVIVNSFEHMSDISRVVNDTVCSFELQSEMLRTIQGLVLLTFVLVCIVRNDSFANVLVCCIPILENTCAHESRHLWLQDNPELALVQARWSFVNNDENLLTRLQNINLSFHFEVEQQVNGIFLNFFGFNGTAGVWRIKALEESGGWLERTTVEDMDIAVRAHLQGWKFIFLNDVRVRDLYQSSFMSN